MDRVSEQAVAGADGPGLLLGHLAGGPGEDLEAALSEFAAIAEALQNRASQRDSGSPLSEDQ